MFSTQFRTYFVTVANNINEQQVFHSWNFIRKNCMTGFRVPEQTFEIFTGNQSNSLASMILIHVIAVKCEIFLRVINLLMSKSQLRIISIDTNIIEIESQGNHLMKLK